MRFFQAAFTKIRDYFTANTGRKIFFFGLLAILLSLIFSLLTRLIAGYVLMVLSLTVASFGTLWDTMATRYFFLKKIKEIQYEHLKEIYDKQVNGENVVFTPTFTDEEKRYLRRRKCGFILMIIFKVGVVIGLFFLLLKTQMS